MASAIIKFTVISALLQDTHTLARTHSHMHSCACMQESHFDHGDVKFSQFLVEHVAVLYCSVCQHRICVVS
jgi:hypothetical protein